MRTRMWVSCAFHGLAHEASLPSHAPVAYVYGLCGTPQEFVETPQSSTPFVESRGVCETRFKSWSLLSGKRSGTVRLLGENRS
jgi:hypothetical protein